MQSFSIEIIAEKAVLHLVTHHLHKKRSRIAALYKKTAEDTSQWEVLDVVHFMLFDCPVNGIMRLAAMHRSQPLFQHIVQLIQI